MISRKRFEWAATLLQRFRHFARIRPVLTYVVASAVTYSVLFVLPYVFPPTSRTRLVSTSYVFGFNNKIAILGFISVLLLLSLFQTDPGLRFLTNLRRDNTRHPNRTLLLIWAGSGLWYLI